MNNLKSLAEKASQPDADIEDARKLVEQMIIRNINEMKMLDSARYTYAWTKPTVLQVYRNGKPEYYVNIDELQPPDADTPQGNQAAT